MIRVEDVKTDLDSLRTLLPYYYMPKRLEENLVENCQDLVFGIYPDPAVGAQALKTFLNGIPVTSKRIKVAYFIKGERIDLAIYEEKQVSKCGLVDFKSDHVIEPDELMGI